MRRLRSALSALGCLSGLLVSGFAASAPAVRLDQCQVLGTHNSYHVAPGPAMDALLRLRSHAAADSLAYTHRPIHEQLGILGIRQLELDVYADPDGGHFARPLGPVLAAERGLGDVPGHDPEGVLRAPGFKILHVPDFDFVSPTLTFQAALKEIREWSAAHPFHFPVLVLVELKEDSAGKEFTQPVRFTPGLLDALDAEIRAGIPAGQRFEPDQLRQGLPTLREAVAGKGWPAVSKLLGKVLFAIDNEDAVRDLYLTNAANLSGRAMFVSVPGDHPAAAWMKVNNPERDFERIGSLVREGFLVRTRADSPTANARSNRVAQRDRALASGAQFVSTDYPEADLSLSPYRVRLPGGEVARANPLTGADFADLGDLEILAAETSEIRNRQGMAAHRLRNLGEASRHYARALELDPQREPTAEDMERVRRLAPELRLVRGEPFRLRDVAVVLHPERPWIGYHLFWEDDLDFPEDNDPCDHEVVWVEYDPASGRAVKVFTYFHGEILSAPVVGGRPRVGVEWGKHGSLPLDSRLGAVVVPANLEAHWKRLHGAGRRLPDHPLGRGWPLQFEGSFEDYKRFGTRLDLVPRLRDPRVVVRSRWPNAVIQQRVLRYNFAAKIGWPGGGDR
jgi:hypothetical protein